MKITDMSIKGTETSSYFITFEESERLKKEGFSIHPDDYIFYKDSILEVDDALGLFLLLKYKGKLSPDKQTGYDEKVIRAINKCYYDMLRVDKYPFTEKIRVLEDILLPQQKTMHKIDIMAICSNIIGKKLSYTDNRVDTAIAWAKHYIASNGDMSNKPPKIQRDIIFMEEFK